MRAAVSTRVAAKFAARWPSPPGWEADRERHAEGPCREGAGGMSWVPSKRADFFLYAGAAVSYISLSIYIKWLLDWIVGPFWLVMWVWGIPALGAPPVRRPIARPGRSDGRRAGWEADRAPFARPTREGAGRMSWAAHQFEVYAVEAHLPKKMDRPDQLVRDLLRRLHSRLPREVLGVRLQLSTTTTTARPSRTSGTGAGRAWASATRSSSGRWCCLGIWAWKHNRAWTDRLPARVRGPRAAPTSTTASARCCCSRSRR